MSLWYPYIRIRFIKTIILGMWHILLFGFRNMEYYQLILLKWNGENVDERRKKR